MICVDDYNRFPSCQDSQYFSSISLLDFIGVYNVSKENDYTFLRDIRVAATTMVFNAELVTLDQKHYTRIPKLKIYLPIPHK